MVTPVFMYPETFAFHGTFMTYNGSRFCVTVYLNTGRTDTQ